MPNSEFSTWGGSRGNRLPKDDYLPGLPVHVQICTHSRCTAFLDSCLADAIFETTRRWSGTLAACLMPDHLHWLLWRLDDEFEISADIRRFKSWTTHVAWRHGWTGALWQRSFWDHVVRPREGVWRVASYILDNPVRAGLVNAPEEWRYSILFEDRFPDET